MASAWSAESVKPRTANSSKTHSARERARSDSDARYLHHIVLYDASNRKITPESTRPYSPKNTCGRCHDYSMISHGWHFNAFADSSLGGDRSPSGRAGEPWVWSDPRTGTQLPLTYRDWDHSYKPSQVGIDAFAMAKKFGGRLPGGGLGEPTEPKSDRWKISGHLEIDCLACHASEGRYDINARRDQVAQQNFAFAPTAAMRWGDIRGDASRIKDGVDLEDEATQKKMPSVTYDARSFSLDGKVFVDLVREPCSNACYQCHSQRLVSHDETGSFIEERWVHDEDVHLTSGMQCVDCHRNGIDHDMVRGFVGQESIVENAIGTLTCEGCHLGVEEDVQPMGELSSVNLGAGRLAGRLGSPQPLHEGLPPIHFEKLTCTACHGGPVPREEAVQIMTSLAHGLGEKGHRTGEELPALVAPVYTRDQNGKIAPHKVMWPAFWGTRKSDASEIIPLDPEFVYATVRKPLRVRKDMVKELFSPKLKSSQLRELLGDERAKTKRGEWTLEESQKVVAKQADLGKQAFQEKVHDALRAIEKERGGEQAVYVSAGVVYAAGDQVGTLKMLDAIEDQATKMIAWPMAHQVRPAGWSLGIKGCTECHSEDGLLFASTVKPKGPVASSNPGVKMASLQGLDGYEHMAWNQLFSGRRTFKFVIATVLVVTFLMLVFSLGQWFGRRPPPSTEETQKS